ncbi:hypothetical protein [Bacillus pseudomycoides]|uniref:Uncharacterized protein n=1 Tax=Bacillus pseudomycoides TaxID=64104 RepID=A0ABD6T5L3_9BACI|nr:hypothetical protein [Bacillus pseudomycoides]MDR4187429.1 hypothetical protein [Bacillus pseudomycoides]MED0854731.1 hypothetical protein [Bacillus pseudomycoides]PEP80805.1 hypothetical protein CN584_21325 [Bacillus pseudomycoides]PGF07502.1 hypothetical protein COM59_18760 [Bacillus pseudomycoides]PHE95709.1 hypothetical protein COF81_14515 [Bacillus pseudomycoides]
MRKILRHEGLGGGAGQRKVEAARSEQKDVGIPDVKTLFCLAGRRESTEHPYRWSWIKRKAQVARSECEGDGASSTEGVLLRNEK